MHLAAGHAATGPSALARWGITCVTAAALSTGCTLITDVDRSKIPAAEVVPPDPPPPQTMDAGNPPAEGDAGSTPDGGTGDAGGTGEPDAGGVTTEPDAGSLPAGDAG